MAARRRTQLVERWLTREVALGSFLAERTDLVVPPSDILPPGPHDSPRLTQRDIDGLRLRLDALTPAVFESSLPAQALHGDASMSNLLRTESGLVWNDLEDVCTGPVAWDVAGLAASARARGHSEKFIEELLAAYGDPGVEDLEPFLEAHALYDLVWQAFESWR